MCERAIISSQRFCTSHYSVSNISVVTSSPNKAIFGTFLFLASVLDLVVSVS